MDVNILAVGDVVGDSGLRFLEKRLRRIRTELDVAFTVVNGENAAMTGLLPEQADAILAAGADVITLGNHAFGKGKLYRYLDDTPYILRPANFAPQSPGRGWGVFDASFGSVCVVNLIGRCGMNFGPDNPFVQASEIVKDAGAKVTLVDFHAEATSEKLAMSYYLDGRVSALWGTHTHVPTADERVCPKGTGYLTDLGMTGAVESVLGIRPEQSIETFLGGLPGRYQTPDGPCKLQGAIFTLDGSTGLCTGVERIDIR